MILVGDFYFLIHILFLCCQKILFNLNLRHSIQNFNVWETSHVTNVCFRRATPDSASTAASEMVTHVMRCFALTRTGVRPAFAFAADRWRASNRCRRQSFKAVSRMRTWNASESVGSKAATIPTELNTSNCFLLTVLNSLALLQMCNRRRIGKICQQLSVL